MEIVCLYSHEITIWERSTDEKKDPALQFPCRKIFSSEQTPELIKINSFSARVKNVEGNAKL